MEFIQRPSCLQNDININNLLHIQAAKTWISSHRMAIWLNMKGCCNKTFPSKQNYFHPIICWDRHLMQVVMHHMVTFTGHWHPLGSTQTSRGQSCGPCGSPAAQGFWTCCLCRFWVCTFFSTCRCSCVCFSAGSRLTLTALSIGCGFSFDRFSGVGGRTACDRG